MDCTHVVRPCRRLRQPWCDMDRSTILDSRYPTVFWLLAGGIAYTIGVAFFAAERLRYSHLGWHLFVIAGTACHFIAVLWYAD